MTRAFGDGGLKEHISVIPNIEIAEIHDDTKFLILASDGLWKVSTYECHGTLLIGAPKDRTKS